MRILIVDDEENMRKTLRAVLRKDGYDIILAENGLEALRVAKQEKPDMVLTDMKMPGMTGLELLQDLVKSMPGLPIIIMTAYGTIDDAVNAMKEGAFDYVTKPFNMDEMKLKLAKVREHLDLTNRTSELEKENLILKEELHSLYGKDEIIGKDPKLLEIQKNIELVCDHRTSVLILGESGVGKELVARAIHFRGVRANKPFVRVNCAAFAPGVLESELFGHEKGAFTGAVRQKIGRIESAHTGTLFLDEIGDISLEVQTKLLRVLQEKEIERVGGDRTIQIDVRIISATNQDLLRLIEEGRFREDLYYRLNVIPITVPPLRERKSDIPELVTYFILKYAAETNKKIKTIEKEALEQLVHYNWPGNVRELENVIERAVVLEQSQTITAASLPNQLNEVSASTPGKEETCSNTREEMERQLIIDTLESCDGRREEAAEKLGMGRTTLWRKMRKYGLG